MTNYLILGIIQGVFEWIPISSEGIVALVSQFLFKQANPIDVALFLHLGTFLAVLVYFRKDWLEIIRFKNVKLLRFLVITTIVSLIIGYPVYRLVGRIAVGNTLLLTTGFALLATAYFQKKNKKINISWNCLAALTGFLQGLAVIPGLSRSGSTVFGLSLGKLSPSEILKISYIISAPVVLVSSIYLFINNSVAFEAWPALISSFVIGLLTLYFLLRFIKKINFFNFALIFGLVCILGGILGFVI